MFAQGVEQAPNTTPRAASSFCGCGRVGAQALALAVPTILTVLAVLVLVLLVERCELGLE